MRGRAGARAGAAAGVRPARGAGRGLHSPEAEVAEMRALDPAPGTVRGALRGSGKCAAGEETAPCLLPLSKLELWSLEK